MTEDGDNISGNDSLIHHAKIKHGLGFVTIGGDCLISIAILSSIVNIV